MKNTSHTFAVALLAALLPPVLPAAVFQADAVTPPEVSVDQINATLAPNPATADMPPGTDADDADPSPATARFVFNSLFDATPNPVTIAGTLRAGPNNSAAAAFVSVKLSWLEPDGTGREATFGPFGWQPDIGLGSSPIRAQFDVPFIPEQLVLEFNLVGPLGLPPADGTELLLSGTFTHQTVVPEPVHVAGLAGLGLIGFAAIRSRRTAKA